MGTTRLLSAVALAAILAPILVAGCEDLGGFTGTWAGPVSPDPVLQKGFPPGSRLTAVITGATRHDLDIAIGLPGHAKPLRFSPIERASADALGNLRLEDDPLRTFLGFVQPPGEPPYLAVVSLYAHERIDVRLIRGPDDAYGVFTLTRAAP